MNDLDEFEAEVRRMLRRRAADIDDRIPVGGAPVPGRTQRRLSVAAVAAALVVILGIGVGAVLFGRTTADRATTEVLATGEQSMDGQSGSESSDDETDPLTDQADSDTDRASTSPLTHDAALASAMAVLPSGFDPATSPAVFVDRSTSDADRVATRYLAERWSFEPSTLVAVDGGDELVVYRWSDADAAGLVVVRPSPSAVEVVAATTDGVAVSGLERTVDAVSIIVDTALSTSIDAESRTMPGDRIGSGRIIVGGNKAVTVPAGPIALVINLSAESPRVMVEFGSVPEAFGETCGVEPPISIDVGAMAGPMLDGPVIENLGPPIINQQVWHHRSEFADLEIRWPADPSLVAHLDISEETTSWSFDDNGRQGPIEGSPQGHALLKIDRPPEDPCAIVQITVDGEPDVAGWWAYALSAAWNFQFPLTIPEFNPDTGDGGQGADTSTGELIAGSMELDSIAAIPAIPEIGSCDGLPDAPPRSGPGSNDLHPDPASALAAFIDSGTPGDPPITETGYTEISVDGVVVAYAFLDDQGVYTVIDLAESSEGWMVTGWTGSAC